MNDIKLSPSLLNFHVTIQLLNLFQIIYASEAWNWKNIVNSNLSNLVSLFFSITYQFMPPIHQNSIAIVLFCESFYSTISFCKRFLIGAQCDTEIPRVPKWAIKAWHASKCVCMYAICFYYATFLIRSPLSSSTLAFRPHLLPFLWSYIQSIVLPNNFLCKYFKSMNCRMSSFLTIFQIFGILGIGCLFVNTNVSSRTLLEFVILYWICCQGITCGAHRLWAHRSYKAKIPFRFLLMIFTCFANQGTILHWVRDHRTHHKYSETDADPHNAKRGFWFSHIGWLYLKKSKKVIEAGSAIDFSDVLQDPVVKLQLFLSPWIQIFCCFVAPSLYTYYMYHDVWLGFFVHGCLRWCVTLHATWAINSFAHLWGSTPYSKINPRENLVTAIFSCGEGWHNWHHTFPFDYAASELGAFKTWNPSKLLIDFGFWIGQVKDRRSAKQLWEMQKKKKMELEQQLVARSIERNEHSVYWTELQEKIRSCNDRPSTLKSFIHLAKDISFLIAITIIFRYLSHSKFWIHHQPGVIFNCIRFFLWLSYAIIQGSIACGLWILAYEAAGNRFSTKSFVNYGVGLIVHSSLIFPFHPKGNNDLSVAKFGSNELERPATLANPYKYLKLFVSIVTLLLVISGYTFLAYVYGWHKFAKWYGGPWIVLNMWLSLYFKFFLKPAAKKEFQAATVMQHLYETWYKVIQYESYPLTQLISFLHHHIFRSVLVQSICANVPCLNCEKAFYDVGEFLFSENNSDLSIACEVMQ